MLPWQPPFLAIEITTLVTENILDLIHGPLHWLFGPLLAWQVSNLLISYSVTNMQPLSIVNYPPFLKLRPSHTCYLIQARSSCKGVIGYQQTNVRDEWQTVLEGPNMAKKLIDINTCHPNGSLYVCAKLFPRCTRTHGDVGPCQDFCNGQCQKALWGERWKQKMQTLLCFQLAFYYNENH